MTMTRPIPGAPFPDIELPLIGGGELKLAQGEGWRLLVVYRGRHCPLCQRYLGTLEKLRPGFEDAGIEVFAVSADPEDRAAANAEAEGWTFPLAYGMGVEQMKTLGLYISAPRSPEETDRPFAEPAVFLVNPEGRIQVVDLSNAPFARPDLEALLAGIRFVLANDYPVRGTLQ